MFKWHKYKLPVSQSASLQTHLRPFGKLCVYAYASVCVCVCEEGGFESVPVQTGALIKQHLPPPDSPQHVNTAAFEISKRADGCVRAPVSEVCVCRACVCVYMSD